MKANLLVSLMGLFEQTFAGKTVRTLPSLINYGGGTKVPAATYGKHTCVSTKKEIRQHNELVNTRQVMRFRARKPTHPSNTTYDY
jgi:hypothetical protein